jgi:hypothetical protein
MGDPVTYIGHMGRGTGEGTGNRDGFASLMGTRRGAGRARQETSIAALCEHLEGAGRLSLEGMGPYEEALGDLAPGQRAQIITMLQERLERASGCREASELLRAGAVERPSQALVRTALVGRLSELSMGSPLERATAMEVWDSVLTHLFRQRPRLDAVRLQANLPVVVALADLVGRDEPEARRSLYCEKVLGALLGQEYADLRPFRPWRDSILVRIEAGGVEPDRRERLKALLRTADGRGAMVRAELTPLWEALGGDA